MSSKENLFYFTLSSRVWQEYEQGKLEKFTDQEQPGVCLTGDLFILQSSSLQEAEAVTLFCCSSQSCTASHFGTAALCGCVLAQEADCASDPLTKAGKRG